VSDHQDSSQQIQKTVSCQVHHQVAYSLVAVGCAAYLRLTRLVLPPLVAQDPLKPACPLPHPLTSVGLGNRLCRELAFIFPLVAVPGCPSALGFLQVWFQVSMRRGDFLTPPTPPGVSLKVMWFWLWRRGSCHRRYPWFWFGFWFGCYT
jgi:hypothetical protein